MRKIVLTLLAALLSGTVAFGSGKVVGNRVPATYPLTSPSLSGEPDFETAAAAIIPAVVYIRTTYTSKDNGAQDQMSGMFGQQPQQDPQMASGSGVIISPDGYIVTNNHVVENAEKIEITTNDHRHFIAKVIGTDPNTDLALIKINATGLPVAKFGNSDDVRVGEWVLAVGNPFNLTSTVTAGIVSAKGRGIGIIGSEDHDQQMSPFNSPVSQQGPRYNTGIESFIQTDAAINPGNSGGALVNTKGELIGINSAIASHTGAYEGYGFAIPINLAKKVLGDLEQYGAVKRGYVGVSFKELDQDAADALHINRTTGLYVNQVSPGSAAAQAGIQNGDVITKLDGKNVYESSDLLEPVGRLRPGDKIDVTVMRGNQEMTFPVTLSAKSGMATQSAAAPASADELFNKLGASFQPLTQDQKDKFQVNAGVIVTQVREGELFENMGIPVGSVVTTINKQPVNSLEDIANAITELKNGNLTIGGFYPDGTKFNNVIQEQQ